MSIFAKGDFHIKDTWAEEKERSKDKDTPKGQAKKNSILQNAAKNTFQPTHHILDDNIAKRVLNQFNMEGPIEGLPSDKNIEARTPSRGSDKGQRKADSKQPTSSKNVPLPPRQKAEKNDDLMTSMAARLSKLEQTCKAQRLELKERNDQISKLKEENDIMKKLKNSPEAGLKEMNAVKEQNAALTKKVEEMQAFLKSYGLRWVGNKMEGKLNKDQLKKDMEKPKYNYHLPSEVDINTVARRIEELNMGLHQEGVSTNQVYKDQGIHRLRPAQPLLIGFYKEGIAIQGYKFFPYKSKESIQILGDILDGYFPYVLKAKYPNGTYMKVLDKIDFSYNAQEGVQINNLETAQDKLLKPMSKEEFLNKLPKTITKNGKVIQVRAAIEDKLDGKKEISTIKEEEQNQYFEEDSEGVIVFKTPEVPEQELCCLKIRTQTGQICLLRLNSQDKMAEVYKWMRHVSKSKNGFKVFGNYPKREYVQKEPQTLEELGLFPNSVLHLEIVK